MAGGIDWFRWHHGSVTDPKFQLVAKKAGARLGDVITVWAFVLEAASADAERGTIGQIDFETLDFLLGADEGTAARILDAMTARGLIEGSRIAQWEKRQPKREREDTGAADRQRAKRERNAAQVTNHASVTPCHATSHQKTPREEESREEKEYTTSDEVVPARQAERSAFPDCPHLEILALWAEVLPSMPQHMAAHWSGARADHLRARWRETAAAKKWASRDDGLAYFRRLFAYVGQSEFLTGRSPAQAGRRPFVIELEWLVNPTNWAKVHEGKYHPEMEAA